MEDLEYKQLGYNPYWETEEFEDLVTRSIIGMFETNLKVKKRSLPSTRLTPDILSRVRAFGCHFPARDRLMMEAVNPDNGKASAVQCYDAEIDGRPNRAMLTTTEADPELNSYLQTTYLEAIQALPKPFLTDKPGKLYRIALLSFLNDRIEGTCDYVVIDKIGNIFSVYRYVDTYDRVTGRAQRIKNIPNGGSGNCEDNITIWANATMQFFTDSRHTWQVRAKEGNAKATFSVYQEQIKSLFYARGLPMTETGRKRPILHWVNAHQRRMKAGTDVDVEKYLRGTHEFVYNNTMFEITNPTKEKAKK